MPETKVAGRYAKSLLGLAVERKIEKKVFEDMELILNTISASRDLALLLQNPIINTDKKDNILQAIFAGKVDAVTMAFLRIITNKRREYYIEDIARQFVRTYKEHAGIDSAVVTTAIPMDDAMRAQVMEVIRKTSKGGIELKEVIDKDIIGGFILTMKDKQFDASLSSKINLLKREMKINLYQKNY